MNILFYTPFVERSRDTETLVFAFKNQGHKVYFITQAKEGAIVDFLKEKSIPTFSFFVRAPGKYLKVVLHIIKLVLFCRGNKIDIVYSHLESANLVAALAQYFIKSKVIVCRHHIDEIHLLEGQKTVSYKLIYRLAKKIIVVSARAKDFMVKNEGIRADKIIKINLAYDFSLYGTVNKTEVDIIKNNYKADLLITTACRLLKDKRPEISVELIEELVKKGINAKLIILGRGELYEELKKLIQDKKLENHCYLIGYQRNVLDYLSAADVLFHPSILDSSSVIIKEAGLVYKPVIACKGVGDVEEYIVNYENGILVDKFNSVSEAVEFLSKFSAGKEKYTYMGENLHKSIISLFSVENILPLYDSINSKNE